MNMVHSTKEALEVLREVEASCEQYLTMSPDNEKVAMHAIVDIAGDKEAYTQHLEGLLARTRSAIAQLQTPTNARTA